MTAPQIEQLNPTQPPPGFTVEGHGGSPRAKRPRPARWQVRRNGEHVSFQQTRRWAVERAWALYELDNDPPGLQVMCWPHEKASDPPTAYTFGWLSHAAGALWSVGMTPWFEGEDGEALARSAAWAWYRARLKLAWELDEHVSVLEYGDDGKARRVATTLRGLFDTVAPMVCFAAVPDKGQREDIREVVETLLERGRATFEDDAPLELVRFSAWPRGLAWPDGLVAAVERWLAEGGEPPEVLRG